MGPILRLAFILPLQGRRSRGEQALSVIRETFALRLNEKIFSGLERGHELEGGVRESRADLSSLIRG